MPSPKTCEHAARQFDNIHDDETVGCRAQDAGRIDPSFRD